MPTNSFMKTYADADLDPQYRADVAVVITSILRPTLRQALQSVFEQDLEGRIQVLVGFDVIRGDLKDLDAFCAERPSNCLVQFFYPGYSTARRHGGPHAAYDGGSLRSLLTLMANAKYIATLDDDNWWAPDHLSSLLHVIEDAGYAFSLRYLVDADTEDILAIDKWHSVGPGKGKFAKKLGGFCDPSTLLLDKIKCLPAIHAWSGWGKNKKLDPDRILFLALNRMSEGRGTGHPTLYYRIGPKNILHRFIAKDATE